MLEADLYPPVKAHLQACGYAIRGEVGDCDMVGWDEANATLVVVELKRGFGLPVLYQALRRLAAADLVYVGVATPDGAVARRNWDRQLAAAVRLCRMLGLGLLSVRRGDVTVHADPGPFAPRKSASRRGRLLGEYRRRSGDHNLGGTTRRPRMTAYREDALRCARLIQIAGQPQRPAQLRDAAGVPKAGAMLRRNVYGWFENTGRGLYALSAEGQAALLRHADVIAAQGEAQGEAQQAAQKAAQQAVQRETQAESPPDSSSQPPRKARARPARPPAPGNPPGPPPPAPAS